MFHYLAISLLLRRETEQSNYLPPRMGEGVPPLLLTTWIWKGLNRIL